MIIDWIYHNHVKKFIYSIDPGVCGFRGSSTLLTGGDVNTQNHDYDCSHVTMTFSALNCLLTLGDDLSRINKKAIISSLKALQLSDGRYFIYFRFHNG